MFWDPKDFYFIFLPFSFNHCKYSTSPPLGYNFSRKINFQIWTQGLICFVGTCVGFFIGYFTTLSVARLYSVDWWTGKDCGLMYFDGLRKTKKTQDRMCLRWERNQAAPKYRSTALPLEHPVWCASLVLVTSVCLFVFQFAPRAWGKCTGQQWLLCPSSRRAKWTQVSPQAICAYRQNKPLHA